MLYLSYHPIFLRPYHFLKLVSFLGANRTKSASVCLWLLRGDKQILEYNTVHYNIIQYSKLSSHISNNILSLIYYYFEFYSMLCYHKVSCPKLSYHIILYRVISHIETYPIVSFCILSNPLLSWCIISTFIKSYLK